MDFPSEPEEIGLLSRRRDLLRALRDEPMEKPALVAEFDHSRSTVDRAIRGLQDAGFVEWVEPGYETTLAGRLALRRYESFLSESGAVLDARVVLNALPSRVDFPLSALVDADVRAVEDESDLSGFLGDGRRVESVRAIVPPVSDSRTVRLADRLLDGDFSTTLVSDWGTLETLAVETPQRIVDAEGVTMLDGTPLSFTLLLVAGEETTTAAVVAEDGEMVGYLQSADSALTEWATDRFEAATAGAVDVTEDVRTAAIEAIGPQPTPRRVSPVLRSQGFDRIDEGYFDDRATLDPRTAWRAGLKVPEVAAGYAVERTRETDDGRAELVPALVERLSRPADVALLGAPGSGKSTVCEQVACEWFDAGHGPVYYRESGQSQPFEDTDALERALRSASGHALVVVEDAVRGEANAVFEAMDTFADTDDVSFLLDAREGEWRDPDDLPVDRTLEQFRQEDVETVRMPPLDDHEQQAIIDRFETIMGGAVDIGRERLLETSPGDSDGATAGEIFLLFHRLARYADPFASDGAQTLTTLDEHADSVREAVAAEGDDALDVAVLVNVLNAAGLGVYPDYLDALAAESEIDGEAVERAVAVLDGEVLFGDGEGGPYRTVHDAWSVRFLERILDAEDEEAAEARFGRGLTALLALADDEQKRGAIGVPGSDEAGQWADNLLRQVFDFGESYPKLAALFGTTEVSTLVLPEVCSRETRLYLTLQRGEMYFYSGQTELAESEYENVVASVSDPSRREVPQTLGRLYARALAGLAHVATTIKDVDEIERYRTALEAFEVIGDEKGIVVTLYELSSWVQVRGEVEEAIKYNERALSLASDSGDIELEAMCCNGLGQALEAEGNHDRSVEMQERSISLAQEAGSWKVERKSVTDLSLFYRQHGSLEKMAEMSRRAVELSRNSGEIDKEVIALTTFAQGAIDRGELDIAAESLVEAANITDDLSARSHTYCYLNTVRGRLERARENLGRAKDWFESVVTIGEENDFLRLPAGAYFYLAQIYLTDSDISKAIEHSEKAVELADESGAKSIAGRARHVRALVAIEAGDYDSAETDLDEAQELLEDAETPIFLAQVRRGFGHLARAKGDAETAREHYETALETFRETGRVPLALETVEDLADLSSDPELWYETGAEIATEAGLDDRAATMRERAAEASNQSPAE